MSLLAAIAGGVASSLASGGIDQLFGGSSASRNWKYRQKELALEHEYAMKGMKQQFDYSTKAFNMQNEYNKPSAVSGRYRAAGINPISVLTGSPGNVGVSGSVSTPTPSYPTASGDYSTRSHTDLNLAELAIQDKLADSQVALNKAQEDKIKGDTKDQGETQRGQRIANDLAEQNVISQKTANALSALDLEFQSQVFDTNVSITKETYENLKKRNEKLNSDLLNDRKNRELTDKQIEQIDEQIWYNQQSIAIAWLRAEDNHALTEQQIKKIQAEIPNLEATLDLLKDEHKRNPLLFNQLRDEAHMTEAEANFLLTWSEENNRIEYKDFEKFKYRLGAPASAAARLGLLLLLKK